MCLILTVHLAKPDAARASEICRAADLPKHAIRGRFFSDWRRRSVDIGIPGPKGGCGCSFLADTADWDAPTWDMEPSTLPRLVGILRRIHEETSSGFSFEAIWLSDSPAEEHRVTIEELVRIAEESKLGTKTRYLVERPPTIQ
jgi:hypothetical protein